MSGRQERGRQKSGGKVILVKRQVEQVKSRIAVRDRVKFGGLLELLLGVRWRRRNIKERRHG